MTHKTRGLLAILIAASVSTACWGQLRAFPEAEGFGALASGGRGGSVYHVTNLNNTGAGSFRDAVSQPNRTVVFDVGGVINITSQVAFSNNITIAGQTAPGGIAVYGHGVSLSHRSNIIVRSMTFRSSINTSDTIKTINMTSASNIILDHVSIGWGRYENFGITKDSGQPESRDITIQNSLIHEAINNQRAGGIIDSSRNLTLARNLFTNNDTRNPKSKGDLQFINNVIYNYGKGGYIGGHSGAPWHQDLINNYFIAGPSRTGDYLNDFNANDRVYHSGNKIDDDFVDTGGDGLPEGRNIDSNKFTNVGATVMPTAYNHPTVPATIMPTLDAFKWVIARAGNALHRDSADQRQINHLKSLGTQGYIPANESQVGGMPTWNGGPTRADTDGDGMPNEFETENGLDINNASDRNLTTLSPLGYTNLEVYLNGLMAPLYPKSLYGDFNGDNVIDAADYIVWRKSGFTQPDYNNWRTHFGYAGAVGGLGAASESVPEPANFSALSATISVMLLWRIGRTQRD